MFADTEKEPKTGMELTAGAKGPIFSTGSILNVLPSITLIPGGGGFWIALGWLGDKQTDIGDCGGDAAVGILGVGGLEAAGGKIVGI